MIKSNSTGWKIDLPGTIHHKAENIGKKKENGQGIKETEEGGQGIRPDRKERKAVCTKKKR